MDSINGNRLRMQDFPNRSFYCIQHKELPEGYPMHQHDFFEIEFVLSGKGMHYLNGHMYPLSRGSIYILNLTDFHEIYTDDEGLEVLTLMFSDHWIKDTSLYQLLCREADMQATLDEDTFLSLLDVAGLIRREYDLAQSMTETALCNLTEYLLIRILRSFGIHYSHLTANMEHPVSRVILYLGAHFRENPSLSSMAAMVNHNVNYFSELFHKTTGQSYVQYLSALKLSYARRLLSSTDTSIMEICSASGFSSYSSFSHAFRKAYGISAIEFRRLHRSSSSDQPEGKG